MRELNAATGSVLLVLALAACGGGRGADTIVVGSKSFTEQRILGEMLAQTVESAGLQAQRDFDLGGTYVCDAALRTGQIDMYVEYTGTALTTILREKRAGRSPRQIYERVKEVYAQDGLVWMEPLGFDNTFALVIRADDAKRLGVEKISDVVPFAKAWTAGFGQEFKERADGYPGLERAYGLRFADVKFMDRRLLYAALAARQVNLVAGNATDAQIETLKLATLVDDRRYFPPYEAAPVVRSAVLEGRPALRSALERLQNVLSAEQMRRLTYDIDGNLWGAPADGVREFLARHAGIRAPSTR